MLMSIGTQQGFVRAFQLLSMSIGTQQGFVRAFQYAHEPALSNTFVQVYQQGSTLKTKYSFGHWIITVTITDTF